MCEGEIYQLHVIPPTDEQRKPVAPLKVQTDPPWLLKEAKAETWTFPESLMVPPPRHHPLWRPLPISAPLYNAPSPYPPSPPTTATAMVPRPPHTFGIAALAGGSVAAALGNFNAQGRRVQRGCGHAARTRPRLQLADSGARALWRGPRGGGAIVSGSMSAV